MSQRFPVQDQSGAVLARLRLALREALRARDMVAASALRSALGAIGNAEAVHPGTAPAAASSQQFAGAVAGLGAAEAERRSLSESEVEGIVQTEIAERQLAALEYERSGHADRAIRLRRETQVLMVALGPARLPRRACRDELPCRDRIVSIFQQIRLRD